MIRLALAALIGVRPRRRGCCYCLPARAWADEHPCRACIRAVVAQLDEHAPIPYVPAEL